MRISRKISAAVLPLLLISGLCWAQNAAVKDEAQSSPSLKKVLDHIESKAKDLKSLSGSFSQYKLTRLLVDPVESKGVFQWQPQDCFRWEVTQPVPFTMVVRGSTVMLLYPDLNRATLFHQPLGGGLLNQISGTAGNPEAFEKAYNLELIPSTELAEQHLLRLSMRPRSAKQGRYIKRIDVIIDTGSWLPQRIHILEANDDTATIELSNLAENTKLPDELFSVAPPAGFQVDQFAGGK